MAEKDQQDTPLAPSATKTPESYILPSASALAAASEVDLRDEHGKTFKFKDLYSPSSSSSSSKPNERQLIIFTRHFFCGSCEEYIRSLCPVLPPSVLSSLSKPTRIIFIGCGGPELIPRYRERTMGELSERGEEVYELYSDADRGVYKALGMVNSLIDPTTPPKYITTGYWSKVAAGFYSILATLPQGYAHKAGPPRQNGGEFLFEGGELVWSHRMQCTQDHCEVGELAEVLGVKK